LLLVDSSVWIDFFNGTRSPETNCLDSILGEEIVLVGDIILAEVLQGFRTDRDFDRAREALGRFAQVSLLSPALAVQSAINFRTLRGKGVTVRKTIDCLIATYCIERNVPLLHADRDYEPFELHLGLKPVEIGS
jgi:predicted nucleic acid-binding protein